jgi:hypothetical protein
MGDERFLNAMFDQVFPCNPIPFARKLADLVSDNGTDFIKSDNAKRILWILNAQAYGQMANINLGEEWDRLRTVAEEELGRDPCR